MPPELVYFSDGPRHGELAMTPDQQDIRVAQQTPISVGRSAIEDIETSYRVPYRVETSYRVPYRVGLYRRTRYAVEAHGEWARVYEWRGWE